MPFTSPDDEILDRDNELRIGDVWGLLLKAVDTPVLPRVLELERDDPDDSRIRLRSVDVKGSTDLDLRRCLSIQVCDTHVHTHVHTHVGVTNKVAM